MFSMSGICGDKESRDLSIMCLNESRDFPKREIKT